MTTHRRSLGVAAAAALLAISMAPAEPARAADYPTRPVSIVAPAPAGSGPDVIARIVADRLIATWRQQVVVVNRPGAGGLMGMQAMVAAKPDGYTLYMPLSSTFLVLPETHSTLPLDLERDIVPIGLIGEQPMIIAVNPGLGVSTLAELIVHAKQRPGTILYGANVGSLPHLTGEVLQERTGIKLAFIPYPNTAKATQDAVAGTTQLMIESLAGLAGPIKSGKLKALASASAAPVPDFPELPTVAEAVPSIGAFESRGWFALMAPAGTPEVIVRKVSEDLRAALSWPGLRTKLASLGTVARPMSPTETAAFIRGEQALWRPVVRQIMAMKH
jgi:tripartite-type tricarboxylate transporter receptor subunit TctC